MSHPPPLTIAVVVWYSHNVGLISFFHSGELLQMNFYLINFSHLPFFSCSTHWLLYEDIAGSECRMEKAFGGEFNLSKEKLLWDILSLLLPSAHPHHKFKWADRKSLLTSLRINIISKWFFTCLFHTSTDIHRFLLIF